MHDVKDPRQSPDGARTDAPSLTLEQLFALVNRHHDEVRQRQQAGRARELARPVSR